MRPAECKSSISTEQRQAADVSVRQRLIVRNAASFHDTSKTPRRVIGCGKMSGTEKNCRVWRERARFGFLK
jgi:hypothetical protein